jgi:hypothetical protein
MVVYISDVPEIAQLGLFNQLFIMGSYGYILYIAAELIGDGSEKLLPIFGPGVVGGLIIPLLGAGKNTFHFNFSTFFFDANHCYRHFSPKKRRSFFSLFVFDSFR